MPLSRELVRSLAENLSFDSVDFAKDPVWQEPEIEGMEQFVHLVRDESVNGFCYLWLLFSIRHLSRVRLSYFSVIVGKFKEIGVNARGPVILEKLLEVAAESVTGLEDGDFGEVGALGSGCFRFDLVDTLPIMHISVSSVSGCLCDRHICEHGWDFIAIVCLLTNPETKMGASTIDFNFLFGEVEQEPPPCPTPPPLKAAGCTQASFVSPVESEVNPPPRAGNQRLTPVGHVRAPTIDQIRQDLKALNILPEHLAAGHRPCEERVRPIGSDEDDLESLGPRDSGSNLGRYKRNFLKAGEFPLGHGRQSWEQLEDLVEEPSELGLVPGGRLPYTVSGTEGVMSARYATKEDLELEAKIRRSIQPVLGLAKPFASQRLNFLSNLYTGMSKLYFNEENPFLDSLWSCMQSESRNPVEDLLKVVLRSTFNKSKRIVMANIFELPYLEVGMEVSEDAVAKCFDMLRSEYKICWFDAMKDIKAPEFHSDFRKYSTVSRSSGTSTRSSRSEPSKSSRPKRKSRSNSGSLLGSLMSLGSD